MHYRHNLSVMSPELEAVVVDQILSLCVNEVEFSELIDMMQRTATFSRHILKKYLFHLIDYDFISYQGKSKVYVITRVGLDLLSIINKEKRITRSEIQDIMICLK